MALSDYANATGKATSGLRAIGFMKTLPDRLKYIAKDGDFIAWAKTVNSGLGASNTAFATVDGLEKAYTAFKAGATVTDAVKTFVSGKGWIGGSSAIGKFAGKYLPYVGLGTSVFDMAKNGTNPGNVLGVTSSAMSLVAGAGAVAPVAIPAGIFLAATSMLGPKKDPFISLTDKGYYRDPKAWVTPDGEFVLTNRNDDYNAIIKYNPKDNRFYFRDNQEDRQWVPALMTSHNGKTWVQIDGGKFKRFIPVEQVASKFDEAEPTKVQFGSQDYIKRNQDENHAKSVNSASMGGDDIPLPKDREAYYTGNEQINVSRYTPEDIKNASLAGLDITNIPYTQADIDAAAQAGFDITPDIPYQNSQSGYALDENAGKILPYVSTPKGDNAMTVTYNGQQFTLGDDGQYYSNGQPTGYYGDGNNVTFNGKVVGTVVNGEVTPANNTPAPSGEHPVYDQIRALLPENQSTGQQMTQSEYNKQWIESPSLANNWTGTHVDGTRETINPGLSPAEAAQQNNVAATGIPNTTGGTAVVPTPVAGTQSAPVEDNSLIAQLETTMGIEPGTFSKYASLYNNELSDAIRSLGTVSKQTIPYQGMNVLPVGAQRMANNRLTGLAQFTDPNKVSSTLAGQTALKNQDLANSIALENLKFGHAKTLASMGQQSGGRYTIPTSTQPTQDTGGRDPGFWDYVAAGGSIVDWLTRNPYGQKVLGAAERAFGGGSNGQEQPSYVPLPDASGTYDTFMGDTAGYMIPTTSDPYTSATPDWTSGEYANPYIYTQPNWANDALTFDNNWWDDNNFDFSFGSGWDGGF